MDDFLLSLFIGIAPAKVLAVMLLLVAGLMIWLLPSPKVYLLCAIMVLCAIILLWA